jgi:branched-chain amino acid transport system substrate-binding protein
MERCGWLPVPADALSRGGFVALTLALGLLTTGCGGAGSNDPIKIAFVTDCGPPFNVDIESTVAGAELPFLQRGAKLRGPEPSTGVTEATVAGRRIQLLRGCVAYTNFTTLLGTLRELVGKEEADIVVGPDDQGEGLVVKEYARKHPGVTFVTSTSGEQSTTLKEPAPNLFRFAADTAQNSAGLGAYAYRTLGWRNSVTVGADDPEGWPQVAGFVAEFCSLGGHIVKRLWPSDLETKFAPWVKRIPTRGIDGVVFPNELISARSFMTAWANRRPGFMRSDRLLVNAAQFDVDRWGPLTARMLGLVGVSNWPLHSTPATRRYDAASAGAFPDLHGGADVFSYDEMEPVLEALRQAHGDLSGGEWRFRRALARLHFRAPSGTITLDRRHQAIAPMYLGKVERVHRKLVVRQIAVIPNVEQTFGGYFGPKTAPPSRTQPACKRGKPPAWVNSVPMTR